MFDKVKAYNDDLTTDENTYYFILNRFTKDGFTLFLNQHRICPLFLELRSLPNIIFSLHQKKSFHDFFIIKMYDLTAKMISYTY